MLPILQIGPLAIQTPGLALLAGVWLSLDLLSKFAARYGQPSERAYNAGFYGLLVGLVAARLAHTALYTEAYLASPLSLISILPGSMVPAAGWIAGPLFVAWYLRRGGALNGAMLDALAPALLVLLASISLANLLSGNGYGTETTLPWAIELWGAKRHPTQVYELLAVLAVLAIVWRQRDTWPFAGAGAVASVVGYSTARLVLEALRGDSWLLPGNVRGAQVLSLLALLVMLGVMAARQQDEAVE